MCGLFTVQYTWVEYYEGLNLIPPFLPEASPLPEYFVLTPTLHMAGIKWVILIGVANWGEALSAKKTLFAGLVVKSETKLYWYYNRKNK